MVLFGQEKSYSTAAGAFLCGIQEGAFQSVEGSIMIMHILFGWYIRVLIVASKLYASNGAGRV